MNEKEKQDYLEAYKKKKEKGVPFFPDLVFTDLNMPEITGIDLILRVRSRFDKDQLPIVMVTTQTQGEDHKMAYGAGANAVIFKPFDKTKLQEVIDQYIQ